MAERGSRPPVVGLVPASGFGLDMERAVFADTDVEFRPVDVESSADLAEQLAGVDAVVDRLNQAPYTREVVETLADRGCRAIVRCGIGVDPIDCEAAAEREMYVVNVPSYCEGEVSDHALMFVLALNRRLGQYDAALHAGRWEKGIGEVPVRRSTEQTLGLVGFGRIARLVAEKAAALGMAVIASDPYVEAGTMADHGVERVSFETVLETADVVSVHAPLTAETAGMFDAAAFARMRPDAHFVNVARGGLVVAEDLREALDAGAIAGAAVDVFIEEPVDEGGGAARFDHPLRGAENVLLTPHVAWFSLEAEDEKRRKGAEEARRVLAGKAPQNVVVGPEAWS